jgi:transcription-repair coupling factor (superfamily II helicase)
MPINLIKHLPDTNRVKSQWGQAQGAGLNVLIAQAKLQHNGPILVITDTPDAALRIEDALPFFLENAQDKLLAFPDWETLPYDNFSPHQDILSQRIKTLSVLPHQSDFLAITSLATLLHRVPPVDYVQLHSFCLHVGDTLNIDSERQRLERLGYRCVDTVYEHGEFAVRGALVDIFPMGSDAPIRIDLFDDEIETLRAFDPETQRTTVKFDTIELLPARETPLTPESTRYFKQQFRRLFDVDCNRCPIYQDISDGIASAGIEYYLPLFFEETATFFEYLPENCLVLIIGDMQAAIEKYWADITERYEDRRHDKLRPVLTPKDLFLHEASFFEALNKFPRVFITERTVTDDKALAHNFGLQTPPDISVNRRANDPLGLLKVALAQAKDYNQRVLLLTDSRGRRESVLDMLRDGQLEPTPLAGWQDFLTDDTCTFGIAICTLEQGVVLPEQDLMILTEAQLFGQRVAQRRRRRSADDQSDNVIRDLTELKIGAPVVHMDHGVGRYQGLVSLSVEDQTQEFLLLHYANEAKLYVPVSALHLISRYSGVEQENAPLHQLGNESWQKEKRKAIEKIHDTAAELLNVYARRAAKPGHAYDVATQDYRLFESEFPFEETPDQADAIKNVIADLKAPQPMDRLVCGDVGFGKTEVAMRAAFVVVQSGKQVAVLVPTTLLAQQHYETFQDRFANWPFTIEVLSRFKSGKDQAAVIDKVRAGKIDILIGTHKLLQNSIDYQDLGLIVIDEEHRFGVKHKEKLKALRSDVDILTLTATPIPRTLNLAMNGVRDISIIATAPEKRLSIKTFVRQYHHTVVKEALLRELRRGGQVYYLHNEVKTIEQTARQLQELVPEARIGIAHGQLRERDLESVMSDFYHKRFNILVCTTIIETGIDVPSANTIIMDRADKLGLAQLHQLRGRVGRSHHQAYAFLLTPHPKAMTSDAIKRLDAIAEADTLGAGFTLASHDLEIRGAGELLGDEQSGHITKIGFSLYMDMLERAVNAIKAGKTPNLDKPLANGCDINLRCPALIPDEYLPDVHLRLLFYKKIANAGSDSDLNKLKVEMIDRFGLLPEAVQSLFALTALKIEIEPLGLDKIEFGPQGGYIDFGADTQVSPQVIVKWVQTRPQDFQLSGANRLRLKRCIEAHGERLTYLREICLGLKQTH